MSSPQVYFIGAGPGDPELLTLKAVKYLKRADIVFYDYLVDERVLEYASEKTELVSLGTPYTGHKKKQAEINQLMIDAARSGKTVARLKGGDPHLFGRLNEETAALRQAGITYEVTAGVTSASGAAQVAGFSLTDRVNASAVAFITGHLSHKHDPALPVLDYGRFATFPGTLVFYMGVSTADIWSGALLHGGMPEDTPVIFVQNATLPNERVVYSALGRAGETVETQKLESPCIVIVQPQADTNGKG
ncbi:MAG: uroporphyrinogen-III C-methyltransferase [Planctomycetaceae bacterium]|nr:uroporphyrinogen-III C-methyltransferase [Planctomycetaceae bacterium]